MLLLLLCVCPRLPAVAAAAWELRRPRCFIHADWMRGATRIKCTAHGGGRHARWTPLFWMMSFSMPPAVAFAP
jgi:hypothetical protein